jgi:hypothetical protein
MRDQALRPPSAWNSYQTKALVPSRAGRAILENEGVLFLLNPALALRCGGDNAYLTHSEPRFLLFFLECGAQGDELLMDLLGVCFLTQIPDGPRRVLRSYLELLLPWFQLLYDVKINNECRSGRFPRASALVAVNCGLAVLAFRVRQSRPPGGISRFQTTFR